MARGTRWSRDELLVVFRLYCRMQYGRLHGSNPEIVELAGRLGRTPGAAAMKACNFASFDPVHLARGVTSLPNTSRADEELWAQFSEDSEAVAAEAESAYARLMGARGGEGVAEGVEVEAGVEGEVPEGPREVEGRDREGRGRG